MRNIAELNILIREPVELPGGLKLASEEFDEGWSLLRSIDAERMEKKIRTRGWNFIRIADGSLRSGVGDSSQAAIASALKLALRRVDEDFSAVEVEHIELTKYPWFTLARVRVFPYRIQQGAVFAAPDKTLPLAIPLRQRRLPLHSAALYPQFGSAMPLLKEMLTSARYSQERTQ
jgi:hypothetical protein